MKKILVTFCFEVVSKYCFTTNVYCIIYHYTYPSYSVFNSTLSKRDFIGGDLKSVKLATVIGMPPFSPLCGTRSETLVVAISLEEIFNFQKIDLLSLMLRELSIRQVNTECHSSHLSLLCLLLQLPRFQPWL